MNFEIRNVFKSFGEKEVLKGISLKAKSRSPFGLLGRNGAGKTTAIRIIMQIFSQDSGEIFIDDVPLEKSKVKIGYLPEERGLYPKRKISEQLIYIAMLKGLSKSVAEKNVRNLLNKLEVPDYYDSFPETLSKGNQQKIQLAMTLLADPDILVLDEPFSGLDPVNAQVLKNIVRELSETGKLIIFSSHQMSQIEEFCEDIAILNGGTIVLDGELSKIKKTYDRKRLFVAADYRNETDITKLNSKFTNFEKKANGYIFNLNSEAEKDLVLAEIINQKISLDHFEILEPTLEEIFIEKAGDKQ